MNNLNEFCLCISGITGMDITQIISCCRTSSDDCDASDNMPDLIGYYGLLA